MVTFPFFFLCHSALSVSSNLPISEKAIGWEKLEELRNSILKGTSLCFTEVPKLKEFGSPL